MRIVAEFQESIVPVIPQITTLLPGVHQAVHEAGTHALPALPEQGKISDFVISISLEGRHSLGHLPEPLGTSPQTNSFTCRFYLNEASAMLTIHVDSVGINADTVNSNQSEHFG